MIGVEPTACPTMTRGRYAYDFGDTAALTPLVKMHTLGHGFIPPGIHAGGLRYHGCSPLISALVDHGLVQPRAVPQSRVFEAAILFARAEGIVPAPETAHAIAAVADLARTETAIRSASSSTSAATDCSTWDRTRNTWPMSSSISSIPPPRSSNPW